MNADGAYYECTATNGSYTLNPFRKGKLYVMAGRFPFVGNLPPLRSEIFVPQLTMNVLNTLWGPYIVQKLQCQKT